MSKLVDRIFSDEPKRRKIFKSSKKTSKRDDIPNLKLTKVEEAIEFDENTNGKKNNPKKSKKKTRRSCHEIRKTNTVNCDSSSEKHKMENIKEEQNFINKTNLLNKKKFRKELEKALNDESFNSNEKSKENFYSSEDNYNNFDLSENISENGNNSKNSKNCNENYLYPLYQENKKNFIAKSNAESKSKLKYRSSEKSIKQVAKKYKSPKKTQKSVMPCNKKKKISFACSKRKYTDNNEYEINNENQDNNEISIKRKSRNKKHRTIRMPHNIIDTQNDNNNSNNISDNNSEISEESKESKESAIVKKRRRKKTGTLKSKKIRQKNNDKDNSESTDYNYYIDKPAKKNSLHNNLKIIKGNSNHGSNRNSNRNLKFSKYNSIEEHNCEESQENNSHYSDFSEDDDNGITNESHMISNGISKKKKIVEIKLNNNEDEKSNIDNNEGSLRLKKLVREGSNNKPFKKMKKNYNELNNIKTNNIVLYKISKLVNNILIKNDYERKNVEIPQKFKVVKPEALISLEYNDKFLIQKDNSVQNYSKVSMRKIEKNENNNIIITRKEIQKKISVNGKEENKDENKKDENSKEENEEKDETKKRDKKKKKFPFCCL